MVLETFVNDYEERISEEDRILIGNFFVMFSRFEFALKATIIFAGIRGSTVEANWDKFVRSIRDTFNKEKNKDVKNAVEFLVNHPPRIQSLSNNTIRWIDRPFQPNTPEITKLNLHIRDIRNNLFHGGKIHGSYSDGLRNPRLLKSAMIVLEEWLELSEEVRNQFLKKLE